jgi:hypothetical protein
METTYFIDWSKVAGDVIAGLNNGSMRLSASNGNVYWASGSGHSGIVEQLPFVPTDLDGAESLMESVKLVQAAQGAQMIAIGISTSVILGAIVIQTMYLAKKIDALQRAIDGVSQDVHAQNIVFYMNKVSDYFGAVEAARIYLTDRSLAGEVQSLGPPVLVDLAIRRNQLVLFIDNILELARSGALPQGHYELIVDFVTLTLDLLPKGIAVERELYNFTEKYGLGELVGQQGGRRCAQLVENYRDWCNQQVKSAISGNTLAMSIRSRDAKLKSLFTSEENKYLMEYVKAGPTEPGATQIAVSKP